MLGSMDNDLFYFVITVFIMFFDKKEKSANGKIKYPKMYTLWSIYAIDHLELIRIKVNYAWTY